MTVIKVLEYNYVSLRSILRVALLAVETKSLVMYARMYNHVYTYNWASGSEPT